LDQAQGALRTNLEGVDCGQEDLLSHRSLVEDLKLATDNLKNATDEYAYLVSNRAATIAPESTSLDAARLPRHSWCCAILSVSSSCGVQVTFPVARKIRQVKFNR
jgi:hypothetical protein